MNESGPLERGRQNLTGIVSVLVTGTWLAALMTGQDWWLGFMLFGYIVIVPIVAMLFGDEEDVEEWWDDEDVTTNPTQNRNRNRDRESAADEDQQDALETLRDRYARGELTDEQFERKVERLLQTETLEDAEDRGRRSESDASTGVDGNSSESRRERTQSGTEKNQ
jgi:uncharacterized membrane protein